ncbi:MAG TPA: hypothetical protein PK953_10685, partial [Smithellaceae bacterium]|nr:hypothetical protein [Syntrophaceae bacterium]HNV57786.1 hypothetical protein [Smithellaceae bacterium]HNY97330.1 hypothetical protein [Smithellaceae bacterium]HOH58163.1 hypothetical protein [Smithellaceae bacterium]HQC11366.1 hypothetical protein [Smithellaceae bacterium]
TGLLLTFTFSGATLNSHQAVLFKSPQARRFRKPPFSNIKPLLSFTFIRSPHCSQTEEITGKQRFVGKRINEERIDPARNKN